MPMCGIPAEQENVGEENHQKKHLLQNLKRAVLGEGVQGGGGGMLSGEMDTGSHKQVVGIRLISYSTTKDTVGAKLWLTNVWPLFQETGSTSLYLGTRAGERDRK